MKKLSALSLTLFIIFNFSAYGQETGNRQQNYKEIVLPEPTHSLAEIGLSAGVIHDNGAYPFLRAQYITHELDHFELSVQLSIVDDYGPLLGAGIGANFPVSKGQSYFYPGASFNYFTDKSMLYGAHIGYTLAVSKYVNLNIEPGYYFRKHGTSRTVAVYSIHAGVRFNL